MGAVSLATVRGRAQRRAGMEQLNYVGPAEWAEYINQRCREHHGLLVAGNYQFDIAVQAITTNGAASYALNAAVLAIEEVTRVDGGSGDSETPLTLLSPRERAFLHGLTGTATYYYPANSALYLYPLPTSGSYKVYYTPNFVDLVADGDTFQEYNGSANYVVLGAAVDALAKEGDKGAVAALSMLMDREEARIKKELSMRTINQPGHIATTRGMSSQDIFGSLGGYTRYRPL